MELINIKNNINYLEDVMDLIYQEWGQFFRTSKKDKINKIKESIKNNNPYPQIYVIVDNNKLIGSFTIKDYDLDDHSLTPWLACVVIKKEYRGKGYGTTLLKYVKEIADKYYPTLYLTTNLVNYYEKIGFKYIKNIEHNGEINRLYVRE